jgi:stearoyl-CoA desaturase (delta-9 desaturase)
VPFILANLIPLAAIWTGVTWKAAIVGVVFYAARVFFITAGYHRYFAHRTFRVGRITQFVLAFGATMSAQKGPLWWAANHRVHHRHTDTPRDPHTPSEGFWWSHVGWVMSGLHKDVDYDDISEFSKYPELRFLDRHDWIGPWTLGVLSFLVAGWPGLVVGFFGSTVVLWHSTFFVNSAAHVWGRRRYDTSDTSRNNWWVALLTFGEGWHNNHHHCPMSARQGHRWWEIDVTYYVLRGLALVGLVKDLREPPAKALESRLIVKGAPDVTAPEVSPAKEPVGVS